MTRRLLSKTGDPVRSNKRNSNIVAIFGHIIKMQHRGCVPGASHRTGWTGIAAKFQKPRSHEDR